jgi:peptidoglycan/xylan/chitin deacetylase (PgdA/CDA1 family)
VAGWAEPGSVIRNLDTAPGSPYHRGEKVVALTFDDGPSPVYTPQILRILAAAKAPASRSSACTAPLTRASCARRTRRAWRW